MNVIFKDLLLIILGGTISAAYFFFEEYKRIRPQARKPASLQA